MEGGRDVYPREGPLGVSLPRPHRRRAHDRLLPLADAQREGGQALPGQGAAPFQGLGEAGDDQHRQGRLLRPGDPGTEGRRQAARRHAAPAGEVPQQPRRSRAWQAQARDPTHAGVQVDEDRQRHPQGLRGDAALKKGQAALWQYQDGVRGEVRLVERAFGIGPSGISEAMQKFEEQLTKAAACNGLVIIARVKGAIGNDGCDLLIERDLVEQLRNMGATPTSLVVNSAEWISRNFLSMPM